MQFLANENFPFTSVRHLHDAGHDVAAVMEDSPGATDADILARAAREARIVLTFDRDYGELIFRRRLPTPRGILYLRFDPVTPDEPGEMIMALLIAKDLVLAGKFTVVERSRIRQRILP